MVAVLYARENSIYKELNTDCWDIKRDARKWAGGTAIIAHPPCRAWGRLKGMAKPRKNEKQLAIHAIIMVRLWGGVVEHPLGSELWKTMNLPKPGKTDHYGGWTLCINQHWFGHRGQKKTLLYIVGCKPKEIPAYCINYNAVTIKVQNMNTKEREKTPENMAKWLIKLAEKCNKYNGHLIRYG